jgi:hypothetical protein
MVIFAMTAAPRGYGGPGGSVPMPPNLLIEPPEQKMCKL